MMVNEASAGHHALNFAPMVAGAAERLAMGRALELPGAERMRGLAVRARDGRLLAGVLYDGWLPNSVQAHMYVPSPIACRHLLPHAFRYPFVQEERGVLWSFIRSDNARSLKMARHLGFSEEGRVRDGYAVGVDLVRVEMRRENCRWLREEPWVKAQ